MDTSIFQHFRKEEQDFIRKVESWDASSQEQYAPILTPFLDPRQQFIVEAIVGQYDDIIFQFEGGYIAAERKRGMIYPDFYTPTTDEFDVALIEIHYPIKFSSISHGQILGSLVGLGIDRDQLGDIISDGERWQLLVTKQMLSYLKHNFQKVGKISIRIEERDYPDLIIPIDHWSYTTAIVSSLRLDTLIASIFHISRQRSKELVEGNKVKVNWAEEIRPDFMIELLDIISIRGYGRIQIKNIEGRTKKDKIKLEIGLLEKNK